MVVAMKIVDSALESKLKVTEDCVVKDEYCSACHDCAWYSLRFHFHYHCYLWLCHRHHQQLLNRKLTKFPNKSYNFPPTTLVFNLLLKQNEWLFFFFNFIGSFKKKIAILGAPSTVVQINTGMFIIITAFCKGLAVLISKHFTHLLSFLSQLVVSWLPHCIVFVVIGQKLLLATCMWYSVFTTKIQYTSKYSSNLHCFVL